MAGLSGTAQMRLHADRHQLQQPTSHSRYPRCVAPSPRSPETTWKTSELRWRVMACTHVGENEATTLAKAVHRWQARRARPRCAFTPTSKKFSHEPNRDARSHRTHPLRLHSHCRYCYGRVDSPSRSWERGGRGTTLATIICLRLLYVIADWWSRDGS